jgi:hypothetical protein
LTGLAGAAALVGLVAVKARPTPAWFKILMVTAGLASSLMMGLTANLGAAIEHAEHMSGAPPAEHEAEEP